MFLIETNLRIFKVRCCIILICFVLVLTQCNGFSLFSSSLQYIQTPSLTEELDCLSSPPCTPETLQSMAIENRERQVGSVKHVKSWRRWSELCLATIRYHLYKKLETPPDMNAFNKLWHNLGIAADSGIMPSFEDSGSRSGYALDFFCRARLLADLLKDLYDNPTCLTHVPPDLFNQQHDEQTTVLSIGGGPGYDVVAIAMLSSFNNLVTDQSRNLVLGKVFDYEEGWSNIVNAMNEATKKTLSINSTKDMIEWGGRCDITQSLMCPINHHLQKSIPDSNIIICQYCVAENSKALEASGCVFFREILEQSNDNSIILLTETTPRQWPDIVDSLHKANVGFELCFVRNIGRGKGGPQMLIRKSVNGNQKVWQPNELSQFRAIKLAHHRKMAAHYERQSRKVRGQK